MNYKTGIFTGALLYSDVLFLKKLKIHLVSGKIAVTRNRMRLLCSHLEENSSFRLDVCVESCL